MYTHSVLSLCMTIIILTELNKNMFSFFLIIDDYEMKKTRYIIIIVM